MHVSSCVGIKGHYRWYCGHLSLGKMKNLAVPISLLLLLNISGILYMVRIYVLIYRERPLHCSASSRLFATRLVYRGGHYGVLQPPRWPLLRRADVLLMRTFLSYARRLLWRHWWNLPSGRQWAQALLLYLCKITEPLYTARVLLTSITYAAVVSSEGLSAYFLHIIPFVYSLRVSPWQLLALYTACPYAACDWQANCNKY